jgi:hypothetical protein
MNLKRNRLFQRKGNTLVKCMDKSIGNIETVGIGRIGIEIGRKKSLAKIIFHISRFILKFHN